MATILGDINKAMGFLTSYRRLSIDNWTFKLYYQWTVTQLLGFSVLISCNQLFGDPIVCDLPGQSVSERVLHSYCLMYSTLNIPPSFTGPCARKDFTDNPIFNTYYQWVGLFMIFQSITFYIPRMIWLWLEGGLMAYLGHGTTGKIISDIPEKVEFLVSVFKNNLKNKYNRYAFFFFECELLNFIIVSSQFLLTNTFLRNEFLFYGPQVLRFYQIPSEEAILMGYINPMCQVFPRIASCTYWRYGVAGQQISVNALCIFSLNIVIDKIYVWLWFWYVTLMIIGACRLLLRLLQISHKGIRFWMMKLRMHRHFRNEEEELNRIKRYLRRCSLGDWFVLYQMNKNLNKQFFYQFLIKLTMED